MPFATSTIKYAPTSLAVTPTGGTTFTLSNFRSGMNGLQQQDPNANLFVFTEDTGNLVHRSQVSAQVVRRTTQKVSADGAVKTTAGQQRLSFVRPAQNATDLEWRNLHALVTTTTDQANHTLAQMTAFQQELVQLIGSQAFLDLISRDCIS